MTVTYGIIEELYTINGSSRLSYGIAAYANAAEDGTSTVMASVHDITSDKNKLLCEIQKYNFQELSLCHLDDIIEDLLVI